MKRTTTFCDGCGREHTGALRPVSTFRLPASGAGREIDLCVECAMALAVLCEKFLTERPKQAEGSTR
jgi:hypothetical protein